MLASIVIPALDEAENLARILPIVQSQLRSADELIVVDNGSNDETTTIAKQFGAIVVGEPVRGRSRARNAGINRARGSVIVFVDADCEPQADWLSELLSPFDDPTVGCVAGEIRNVEAHTPFSGYLSKKGHLAQAGTFNHPFLPYAQTGNAAYRRIVIDRIGPFDETMSEGEDADLSWRMLLETSYRIVVASRSLVTHHQDLSLSAFLKQKRRHAQGAVALFKKYRDRRMKEVPSYKETYWEYQSLARRGFRWLGQTVCARVGFGPPPGEEQRFQLLIEFGEKLGRIQGSIQHRVWYP